MSLAARVMMLHRSRCTSVMTGSGQDRQSSRRAQWVRFRAHSDQGSQDTYTPNDTCAQTIFQPSALRIRVRLCRPTRSEPAGAGFGRKLEYPVVGVA